MLGTMKHISLRHRKPIELPIAWREAEYAALQNDFPDTFDDRVSEDIFDADGERNEVDMIIHALDHTKN